MQLVTFDEIIHDLRVKIQFAYRQNDLRTKMQTEIMHIRSRGADVYFTLEIIGERKIGIYGKCPVVTIGFVVSVGTRQTHGIAGIAIHRTGLHNHAGCA